MMNVVYASSSVRIELQVDNDVYTVKKNENIEIKSFATKPVMLNNTVFVPVRSIFEHLGATVDWINETETVRIKMDKIIITMQKDSNKTHVNDKEHLLKQAVTVINNNTMIPLRFISETLGYNVIWDGSDKSITISNEGLTDKEKDFTVYADEVAKIQMIKSLNPHLDYMRNTIAKIWMSNTFERISFREMSAKVSQIANTMQQAEILYQELYPDFYEKYGIKDSWKYFEYVRMDFGVMSNGDGELIDQEDEFLASVHKTISQITNYRDEVLNSDSQSYSNLEKLAMLMDMVPKDEAEIRLNKVRSKQHEKFEVPLTMDEAMTYIDSKYEIR